jgi:glucose/arabinose dehydrogenase
MRHAPLFTATLLVALFATSLLAQQPEITPRVLKPLHRTPVIVPQRFAGMYPDDQSLWLPEGWRMQVFHAGDLGKPRFLDWSPDSVLHVADLNLGRVIALPDRNRDGVADEAITVAENVEAHDVAFFRGAMYAAEETRVLKLVDADLDGVYETRTTFIEGLPAGGHTTRTIVFDAARSVVYVSVGSASNAGREELQAVIYEFDLDGGNRRIFASGVRNAVGMTLHPVTGRLWATNNGQDWQGDDIPPEWISVVRDGGFYGYPIAYSGGEYFDFSINAQYRALLPITATDSARVRSMIMPGAEVTAHSAPMAIEFANASTPSLYRNGAFVALHGSWNRSVPTGYDIIHLDFDGPLDTVANSWSYVVAADTNHATSPVFTLRPCGLALDSRGNLYFSSDHASPIIGILYPAPLPGSASDDDGSIGLTVTPNPVASEIVVSLATHARAPWIVDVVDARGASVISSRELAAGARSIALDASRLASGVYTLRARSGATVLTRRVVVVR